MDDNLNNSCEKWPPEITESLKENKFGITQAPGRLNLQILFFELNVFELNWEEWVNFFYNLLKRIMKIYLKSILWLSMFNGDTHFWKAWRGFWKKSNSFSNRICEAWKARSLLTVLTAFSGTALSWQTPFSGHVLTPI